jgi:mannose-1-phosphate guanylyltransferase
LTDLLDLAEFLLRFVKGMASHRWWMVERSEYPLSHQYGCIELGRPLDSTEDRRVWQVCRFWEKPSEEKARMCLEAGCLWNSFVLVGKAATFLRAGREAVPDVCERLARLEPFFGTDEEAWALHQAYGLIPKANFSRAVSSRVHHAWRYRRFRG